MRVIMFPAIGVKDENRFIDILVSALREVGVEVENWTKHFSLQKGDIFHIHWPEIIPEICTRKWNSIRGQWIKFQFLSTIRRIKKSGGYIVWTVHDLYPHNYSLRRNLCWNTFMQKFMLEVDICISLTANGIEQIKSTFPLLRDTQFCVAHHPHYRDVLSSKADIQTKRASLGIMPDQKIYSFIGTLRQNKRPDLLANAFRHLPSLSNYLIIAGAGTEAITTSITHILESNKNVRLDFRRVPQDEIVELYATSDILVFPGNDYFNSGTIYTALSLNVPVLAAWSPTNQEIQDIVGRNWLYLYKDELTSSTLLEAGRALVNDKSLRCDLTAFSPSRCAQEHLEAYKCFSTSSKP